MYSSVPVQDLRGSDATLLEVQIPEMLRRPLGQVHILNVFDMMQLAVTEGCPKVLQRDMKAWVEKTERQILDLPRGASFDEFLSEVAAIGGGRVPLSFRALMKAEGERRGLPKMAAILEVWEEAEPKPFTFGSVKAKVQRAEMVTPRKRSADPSSAPSERRARQADDGDDDDDAPKASRAPAAAPIPRPVEDIERRGFLEQLCLQRLAGVTDKGLAEAVLVAGVKHLAKDRYDDVTPRQVLDALKSLKESGRARYSAGRWSYAGRY
jgi:hypothetical protein